MIKQDEVRSALADVRSGLAHFERLLDTVDTGNGPISHGYIDLVGALMIRGSVDVWYRGEYIAVPFRRLSEWFRNPMTITAERHQVDEATVRRWADREIDESGGTMDLPCNHPGCRRTRTLAFYGPQEMHAAEVKSALAIWYCHHHRLPAWQSQKALSDDHVMALKRVHDLPGCSRQQLGAKKSDTDFLLSLGLLSMSTHNAHIGGRALAFYLTDEGQRYVLNL
ncbi:hypothetical protein [Burkholderia cepacia]|uniref:hypothetical protein n=1 Tax=Burkholderia cepacia TaxID=292 RepID=UPI001782C93B|nr:hypothetical protein [Burkholderia cepacia]